MLKTLLSPALLVDKTTIIQESRRWKCGDCSVSHRSGPWLTAVDLEPHWPLPQSLGFHRHWPSHFGHYDLASAVCERRLLQSVSFLGSEFADCCILLAHRHRSLILHWIFEEPKLRASWWFVFWCVFFWVSINYNIIITYNIGILGVQYQAVLLGGAKFFCP